MSRTARRGDPEKRPGPEIAALRDMARSEADPLKSRTLPLLGRFLPISTDFYRCFADCSDFLGRLQPSKTTIQKTLDTLGVEESSSPRRVLALWVSPPIFRTFLGGTATSLGLTDGPTVSLRVSPPNCDVTQFPSQCQHDMLASAAPRSTSTSTSSLVLISNYLVIISNYD